MSWKQTSVDGEQARFIERWQAGGVSFVDLCRDFDISRKTGYKRVDRFRWNGWEGLGDLSRAPRRRPNTTPRGVAERLITARMSRPTWGPKKLVAWLRAEEPVVRWPAASTAGDILDRAGLVRRRKRRRHAAPWDEPFAAADHPNDVWSIDFKGWFRTQDGVRVDPLTVQDAASRYLLVCNGLEKPNGPQARRVLERAFREYGLPWAIRSDNGPPFASVGLGSLSPLAVWWVKLGIVPERIEPGHPEQNGRLERLHRTLKAETATPPRSTRRTQQRAFDTFRDTYNTERPHEALGQTPPARLYHSSYRPYPNRVSAPEYELGVTVRKVRTNGQIKWRGDMVYLSEALKGEPIGLVPQDDRYWNIQFGPLSIGLLNNHARCVLNTPIKVSPMSPV
ncbi:MAG: IS481 family transposase [Chloroflexi bacterium]|nr:IS481 family transposase [Chloroflexota bacterium]